MKFVIFFASILSYVALCSGQLRIPGQSCDGYKIRCVKHSNCMYPERICRCEYGFFPSENKMHCFKSMEKCDNNYCYGPNRYCDTESNLCKCDDGYFNHDLFCSSNEKRSGNYEDNCYSRYNCEGNLICKFNSSTCGCQRWQKYNGSNECIDIDDYCDETYGCDGAGQKCDLNTNICKCQVGYHEDSDFSYCLKTESALSTGELVAAIVVPIVIILIVIFLIWKIHSKKKEKASMTFHQNSTEETLNMN